MERKKPKNNDLARLDQLYSDLKRASKRLAGYPENQVFDYSSLFRFLKFSINNCGDPFQQTSTYRVNTHEFEKELVDEFAQIFHAHKNDYWGYVTNGGTEGNLFGLYVAREMYPKCKVYCSSETHYSIYKNIRLLRMEAKTVKALSNGEIDYSELKRSLARNKKTIPIIVANIGTTMKGAIDSVPKIIQILSELGIKKYYIHCDAALFGMILPFLPHSGSHAFDFRAGVDSIAISGHKMIGMPIPCGVVLVKKSDTDQISNHIEYTGATDNTITGSRNGITALFLWYEMIHRERKHVMEKSSLECIKKADYAIEKFRKKGIQAWRNENSIIVVFPRPSESTRNKWQLAVEGRIAHIITLPHVSYNMIDQIVLDVASDLKKAKLKK